VPPTTALAELDTRALEGAADRRLIPLYDAPDRAQ